jgi:hypothetical protein
MNGFDEDMLIDTPPPTGRLLLLFAGTIYYRRSPMPLLNALQQLLGTPGVDRSKVRLDLVGHCSTWQSIDLVAWVRENRLEDCVHIRGLIPRREVATLTRNCNVLVNLAQEQKQQIPAKLFEHMASRRVVLLFAESDSDSAVAVAGRSGVFRLDDDVEQVAAVLRQLYATFCLCPVSDLVPMPEADDALSRRMSNEQLVQALERAIANAR